MKNHLTLIMILFLGVFSCKKEETTKTSATPTTAELISSARWKVTNFSSPSTDSEAINFIKEWNEDLKKGLYVSYNSNGTYIYSDSSEFGTWELSGNNAILFDKGPDQYLSSIDKLTSNDFVITYPWKISDSLTIIITETTVK